MWNCARCRAEVDDGFEVCWQCGTSMDGQADPSFRPAEADAPTQATATEVTAPLQKLVHVAEAVGVERAEVIRRHLEGAAIAVFIADEPAGLLPPTVETATLQVREADAERARAIIADIPAVPPPPPPPDLELPEKPAAAPPPPAGPPGVWEPPNKAELSPPEYIRALEVRLSGLIDDQDVPGWKVNPAFAAEVNAFVASHANNAPFLKKAQSMQQNKAKYFATIRAQDEQRKKEAEEEAARQAAEAAAAAEAARLAALEPAAPKPPSEAALAWRRRLRRFTRVAAMLLIATFVLGFIGTISYDHMGATELKKATARVDESDKDWEWDDLQKKRAAVKAADNGAPEAIKALDALPPNWPADRTLFDRISKLAPGVPLTEDEEDQLRLELDTAEQTLLHARYLVTFTSGGKYSSEDTDKASKAVANAALILWLDAVLRANDRKRDEAMASARALLVAGRTWGDDPTPKALPSRCQSQLAACLSVQRVLGQGVAEDEALKETQRLFEDESKQPVLINGLRGLRAFMDRAFAEGLAPRTSEEGRLEVSKSESLVATAGRWVLSGNDKENRALALDLLTEAVEIGRLPPDQQEAALAKFEAKAKEKCASAWPADRYTAGASACSAAAHMIKRARQTQATLRATIVALAAERYRLANDRWPKSMEELEDAKLLAKEFTVDPFTGQPLQWVKEDDGIRISSGQPEWACRLWDLEYRRYLPVPEQLPLPAPVAQK